MDQEQARLLARTAAAILSPIVIFLIFRIIGRCNQKELQKSFGKERVTLRMPRLYFGVGIVCTAGYCIFFIAAYLQAEKKDLPILYGFIAFFGFLLLSVIIPCFTWKIELSKSADYLIYRNIIGWSYKIRYEDILCYEKHTQSIVVRTKRKKFSVGYEVTNYERLIEAFSDHGIDRLRFYAWQKEKNSAAPDQDNEPDALPKPRKRRFYQGKGPH